MPSHEVYSSQPRPHPGLALSLLLACQLIVLMDATVVTVALPSLQRDLEFTPAGLSWVQNAYMLALGGLLLLGGRTGDMIGRRKALLIGVAGFTLASLLGGLAMNATWLLVTRAVQGASASLIAPSILALLTAAFAEGEARNRALGIYSAVSGAGLAIGLILGGLLTESSWRWVMFINVPLGAAALLLAPRFLGNPPRHAQRLDILGAVTSTMGTTVLVYALMRGAETSRTYAVTISALVIALLALTVFVIIERRSHHPLVPLTLFANRRRAAAYLNMLLIPAAMFSMFFFLTQFFQDVLEFGPLQTGAAFLPLAATQFIAARSAPRLLRRLSPATVSLTGTVLIAAGIGWLTRITPGTGYVSGILGPMLLFGVGVGVGLCFMPLNMIIMSGLPAGDTGTAAGVLQAMQQIGGALGLAVLVSVAAATIKDATGSAQQILSHGMVAAFTAGTLLAAIAAIAVIVALLSPRSDRH